MSKITIEDISRHTGLSRGTVSRALNDRPDISRLTKQKVLDACRQLNYVPSLAARSLATGRAFAVAVLVDDLRSVFAACFLRGVIVRAQAQRYAVYVSEMGSGGQAAAEHLNSLARERVDGVLLTAPLDITLARSISEILDQRPLIAPAAIPGVACDVLSPDYTEGGRLVARHILRGGNPDVLYVHDPGVGSAMQRLAGFQEICRQNHLDPDQATLEIPPRQNENASRLDPVRARLPGLRALVASDDFLAVELMLLAQQSGRAPGRDLAIVGQGNELISERVSPGLTTIDYCAEEIGRRAMDLALQRFTKARQDAPQVTHVAPTLIDRGSTRLPQ